MFCLRVWLLPLFFLSSAPPLYLLLFLTATYILQRPCVYCSLLLAILILVLFDFNRNWFELQTDLPSPPSTYLKSNGTSGIPDVVSDGVAVVAGMMNNTAGLVANGVAGYLTQSDPEVASTAASWLGVGWLKTILKKELRIPCVNVVIRL